MPIKRLATIILLTLFTVCSQGLHAQVNTEQILDTYLSAINSGEDTTPYITKIIQRTKGFSQEQLSQFKKLIIERLDIDSSPEEKNPNTAMALINLYAQLASSDDKRLDDLYFHKGEICALQTGDTIMLKESIMELKLSDYVETEKTQNYIKVLNEYLEQIRNYVPMSKRLDGIWISDLDWTADGLPAYVLIFDGPRPRLDIGGYAASCLAQFSTWGNLKDEGPTFVQSVEDLNDEKVYMAWSNEKLKVPNQKVAQGVSQAAGDMAYSVFGDGVSTLINSAGGDFVGNAVGNAFGNVASSLVSDAVASLFAPSKKIYVMEMELKKNNDKELIATAHRKNIKIGKNGVPSVQEYTDHIKFIRYNPESGVFFYDYLWQKFLPGKGILKKGSDTHPAFETTLTQYSEVNPLDNSVVNFNDQQLKKQLFLNHLEMTAEEKAYSIFSQITIERPYLGLVSPPDKQKKVEKGVYIYDVDQKSPAYIFGVRSEDVLLEIDGYEMNNMQQVQQYLESLQPYDWVTLLIKRGKKTKTINVELTWQ